MVLKQKSFFTRSDQYNQKKQLESNEVLEGAGFKGLQRRNRRWCSSQKNMLNLILIKKLAGWTTEEADATEVTTGADGTVTLYGLDLGTYKFKEVTAPSGYSINTNDVFGTLLCGQA